MTRSWILSLLLCLLLAGSCWCSSGGGGGTQDAEPVSWALTAIESGDNQGIGDRFVKRVMETSSSAVTGPDFAELIRNVTVPLGREAVLSCVINNLAEYKVGWLRADDQTILSLHRRVVTHNPRVSVTHDESRTWNLHIRQIKESDQGCYMCQINTATMKKQLGCIQVQVPPDIVDEQSTSDVTVNEGDNVTLTCVATGKPSPRIVWRREDGHKIVIHSAGRSSASSTPTNNHNQQLHVTGQQHHHANQNRSNSRSSKTGGHSSKSSSPQTAALVTTNGTVRERSKVEAYHGETLRLYRVTRQMMAAYMCIASNDVPPAVSKRVPLNVNFAPLVTASMNVVGALIGTNVRLSCSVESHPPSINYWIKGRHQEHNTILASAKYSIDGERGSSSPGYKTSMTLFIHDFQPEDRSVYICVAANSLGTAEASIQIYEVTRATAGPTVNNPAVSIHSQGYNKINDDDDQDRIHRHHQGGEAPSTSTRWTAETTPTPPSMSDRTRSSASQSFQSLLRDLFFYFLTVYSICRHI